MIQYRENESGLQILELEITRRCNLNCAHCYAGGNQKIDMPENKIFNIIDEANDMKINRLVFTGGEPLLSDGLFKYAQYAREKGIPDLALLTNGTLLEKETAKKCTIFDGVQMSLDGTPKKFNNNIRKDYFDKLEKAIKLLQLEGIPVTLYITLNNTNIDFLDDMILYSEGLGCRTAFNCLIPTNDNIRKLILTPAQLMKSLKQVVENGSQGHNVQLSHRFRFLVDNSHFEKMKLMGSEDVRGGCLAGIAAGYITAEGNFLSCPFVKISCGNVNHESLNDIWHNSGILNTLRNRKNFKGPCGKCEYSSFCGGCRAISLSAHGTIDDSDNTCFKELVLM